MKLIVMNPLELGDKLTELEIKEDWTIGAERISEGIGLVGELGILAIFFKPTSCQHSVQRKHQVFFRVLVGAGVSICVFLLFIFCFFVGSDSQLD